MSNTITVSAQLSVSFGTGGSISGASAEQLTQSGSHSIDNIQSVGTTAEAIVLGDLANAAFILIENLDNTNYVEIALDNSITQIVSKLKPGGMCLISPETVTIYGKANTAACNCRVTACEA